MAEKRYINPYGLWIGSFVPNWLMRRPEVSPGAKLCYAQLCQHAGQDGKCYPGQDVLGVEMGVSERQVRRYVAELIEQGLMEEKRRGMGMPNDYFFLDHAWINDYRLSGRPDRNDRSREDRNVRSRPDKSVPSRPDTKGRAEPDINDRSFSIQKNQPKESAATHAPAQTYDGAAGGDPSLAAALLVERGVDARQAVTLAKEHSLQRVEEVCRVHDHRIATAKGLDNPAGFIVQALRENLALTPPSKVARAEKRQQADRRLDAEREGQRAAEQAEAERVQREREEMMAAVKGLPQDRFDALVEAALERYSQNRVVSLAIYQNRQNRENPTIVRVVAEMMKEQSNG